MYIYRCIVGDMDALELIQLGRELTKIGEEALRGSKTGSLPNGPSLVLRDVFANRDSAISEIADRTALPLIVLVGQLAGIVLIVFGVGAGLPLMSLRFRAGRSRPKQISEGDVRR